MFLFQGFLLQPRDKEDKGGNVSDFQVEIHVTCVALRMKTRTKYIDVEQFLGRLGTAQYEVIKRTSIMTGVMKKRERKIEEGTQRKNSACAIWFAQAAKPVAHHQGPRTKIDLALPVFAVSFSNAEIPFTFFCLRSDSLALDTAQLHLSRVACLRRWPSCQTTRLVKCPMWSMQPYLQQGLFGRDCFLAKCEVSFCSQKGNSRRMLQKSVPCWSGQATSQ